MTFLDLLFAQSEIVAYPAFINLGVPELSIIVLLVLILFGPGKLPGVMKSLGDGVRQFKDASNNPPGSKSNNSATTTQEHPPES